MNTKINGFTLIELVVVIVILGILAATAAPRFLDLSSDAKTAALQGVAGAIATSGDLVYAKAVIQGLENTDQIATGGSRSITLPSGTVYLSFGYPVSNGYPSGTYNNDDVKNMWKNVLLDLDDSFTVDLVVDSFTDSVSGISTLGSHIVVYFDEDQRPTNISAACAVFYRMPFQTSGGGIVAKDLFVNEC